MTATGTGDIGTSTRVALCIITFKRPEGLRRLLGAIDAMSVPGGVEVTVVVVDNDPEGTGGAVIESMRDAVQFPIAYSVEARRGIPFARNVALAGAVEHAADWIGWLDDDESPHADWLERMLATQAAYGADVVLGPNAPVFEAGSTLWITQSGLLNYERFATGERYPYFHTRTSGVIMRASVVPAEGFEERMALSGGSDRLFFTRVHRAGGVFVYDNDAVVIEYVPASRAQLGWLLRRWYRTGVTRSLTMLYLDDPGLARRARRVLGGSAVAAKGVLRAVLALPKGRIAVLHGVRLVLLGVGASVGALGLQYREYRTVHGR